MFAVASVGIEILVDDVMGTAESVADLINRYGGDLGVVFILSVATAYRFDRVLSRDDPENLATVCINPGENNSMPIRMSVRR